MNNELKPTNLEILAPQTAQAYPLFAPDAIAETLALIDENLGSEAFNPLMFPRIRVPSGGGLEFRVEGASGERSARTLDGIIMATRHARAYWKIPYGRKGAGKKPPDCTSTDGFRGVGDPGGPCADCPFAQFGTATNPDGSKGTGQACKDLRQLLILLEGEALPHLLSVPPTSIRKFTSYTMNLTSARTRYWGGVTRLSLERASSEGGIDYARIDFKLIVKLDPALGATIAPYHHRMRELLVPAVVDTTAYEIVDEGVEAPPPPGPDERNPDDIPF
jgi:hypothetical protein